MFRWVPLCFFSLTIMVGVGTIALAQEGETPVGPKGSKPAPAQPTIDASSGIPIWNLESIDERYRGGIEAIQELRYKDARGFFKAALRQAKKEGNSKTIKKLSFLEKLSKDLDGGDKLARKSGNSVLRKAVALTVRNRETFAYFHFLEIERRIRDRFTLKIADFEPPLESYQLNELKLFEPFRPRHTPTPQPYQITNTPKLVPQGKWAMRWEDSPQVRNLGTGLASPTPDWTPYRYLCFSAKLADPSAATLRCVIAADQLQQNRWIFGAGSWKGWKSFRIDFRKEATIKKDNADLKMSWSQVSHLVFYGRGGLSNFYLDDIYLCK